MMRLTRSDSMLAQHCHGKIGFTCTSEFNAKVDIVAGCCEYSESGFHAR